MKKLLSAFFLSLCVLAVLAGNLTPAQVASLRPVVLAEPTLAAARNAGDDYIIAAWCNAPSSPAFTVWRTRLTSDEVMSDAAFDWTRVDNLTAGRARIWEMMFRTGSINPSLPNVRAGIDATWVGTAPDLAVRASVYSKAKRISTRAEKALATGTGTDAVPATLTFEGAVAPDDASLLR